MSFYTLSLKLKLVSHLLFNGHEIFTKATIVILLQNRVFHFWIATSGFEQYGDKTNVFRDCQENHNLSPYCSTPEAAIQKLKTLFCSKITKVAWVKFSYPVNKR